MSNIFALFFTTEPVCGLANGVCGICQTFCVYSQLKRVTDGQTDRQTDGQTEKRSQ